MDRAREGGRQTNGRKKESNTHKKKLGEKEGEGKKYKGAGNNFFMPLSTHTLYSASPRRGVVRNIGFSLSLQI